MNAVKAVCADTVLYVDSRIGIAMRIHRMAHSEDRRFMMNGSFYDTEAAAAPI